MASRDMASGSLARTSSGGLEDATGLDVRAPGFPPEMTDDEPEEPGYEVVPNRG